MKITKFLYLLILVSAFISCREEEESIDVTNITGEYFKELSIKENVQIIRLYTTRSNASDEIAVFENYSFPGSNFIRVWRGVGTHEYSRKNYNLDRIIWYDIDNIVHEKEEISALTIEFDTE